jgi:hypothetical protein
MLFFDKIRKKRGEVKSVQLLENAKGCFLYGISLFPLLIHGGLPIFPTTL